MSRRKRVVLLLLAGGVALIGGGSWVTQNVSYDGGSILLAMGVFALFVDAGIMLLAPPAAVTKRPFSSNMVRAEDFRTMRPKGP